MIKILCMIYLGSFVKGLVGVLGGKSGDIVGRYLYKKAKATLFGKKEKDGSQDDK
ncbi:hypothetical protein ABES36_14915 [Bacillus pseudomycoides]|uniref:hypothetical protein n=1 Tax=Bacillus pseudomycoides TaxID=64104 RepID=UPI003D21E2FF